MLNRVGRWILGVLLLAVSIPAFAEPRPPAHVKAERQDFQAARITWVRAGENVRYRLYAAHDVKPLDFHQENNGEPMSGTFVIWDAPRLEPRRFVFYVTAVDSTGNESKPSKHARVDLGPLPAGL